jgi:hypothetical protein
MISKSKIQSERPQTNQLNRNSLVKSSYNKNLNHESNSIDLLTRNKLSRKSPNKTQFDEKFKENEIYEEKDEYEEDVIL